MTLIQLIGCIACLASLLCVIYLMNPLSDLIKFEGYKPHTELTYGDVVMPINGNLLHCSTQLYGFAVVLGSNSDGYINLVSVDASMNWTNTYKSEDLRYIGRASNRLMNSVKHRLKY